MMIIRPTILEPLEREWGQKKASIEEALGKAETAKTPAAKTKHRKQAEKLKREFINRLNGIRVLDPACGSGNFLYLALLTLKDFEYRVQLTCEAMGLQRDFILGYTGGVQWEGDYATGDVGSFDADGFLTIHGRKKNLLITAYGRNISPEWPESLLSAQPEIAQAFVYGDGQASLSALLVPSYEGADIGAALQRVNAQLPDYARIGAWKRSQPFTAASGMATGNGRLRRDVILSTLSKELNDGFLRPTCA